MIEKNVLRIELDFDITIGQKNKIFKKIKKKNLKEKITKNLQKFEIEKIHKKNIIFLNKKKSF